MRLLLVEDSEDHAELVRRSLQHHAMELRTAPTLAEARALVRTETFDLVLSDLQLPDGTAIDLLSDYAGAVPFPVVVMTGHGDENLAVTSIKAGAVDYLVKSPETLRELPHVLERARREWGHAIEHRRMQRALAESEQCFRTLVNAAPSGILVIQEGRCVYANPAIEAALGYSADELAEMELITLVLPSYRESLKEIMHAVAGSVPHKPVEYEVRCRKGQVIHAESVSAPLIYRGKPSMMVICQDISLRKQTEAALRVSERKFRTLVENVPGVVIRRDVSAPFHVLFASHGVLSLTGHASSAFEGEKALAWSDIVLPEDLPRAEARILESIHHGLPYEVEYRIRTKSGMIRIVFERGCLGSDMPGMGPCVDGVLVDVTDRRSAEQALRVSQERLRLAMEATSDGLWDWDVLTGGIYWSTRAYTMLGYRPSEFTLDYDSWKALVHPEDIVRAEEEMWRQMNTEGHFSVEYRLRTAGGGWKWINDRGKPVAWDQDHRMTRVVGTHVDMDQRMQAEQRLQESKQRFQALFEKANDAIVVADASSGLILSVNGTAEKILGRAADELVGKQLTAIHPVEERERYEADFRNAARGAFKSRRQMELLRSDGHRIPVEISMSLIELPHGQKVLQGIYRDLSERQHLEAQLRQAQKMEAIGQLAGGVAHDFNNVLAAIMLQLSLLQADRRMPVDMQSTLTVLESSTKRAADLTRQLLLFGRRQPAKMQEVDADALVANLLKMLRRLIGETIRLEFTPQAAGRWIHADPGMIEQVIMNLVVNARDAMPKGGVLEITLLSVPSSQLTHASALATKTEIAEYLVMAIRDNGHGIDPETLKRIFEPFFTTKQLGKGTGLGLATAYSIVKQHDGWIEVESHPGQGACFRVYLPQIKAPMVLPKPVPAAVMHPRGRGTILLVEDDNIVRTFTSLSLRSSGYTVLDAKDGRDAGVVWEDHKARIDYLLTDMVMPNGVSGWDLIVRCRADKPVLAVVLMSGYPADLPKVAFDSSNRIHFLQKPFDANKLNQSLKAALEQALLPTGAPGVSQGKAAQIHLPESQSND